jgi:hypothetical protein
MTNLHAGKYESVMKVSWREERKREKDRKKEKGKERKKWRKRKKRKNTTE